MFEKWIIKVTRNAYKLNLVEIDRSKNNISIE
jgi:hypothetical protein